MTPSSNRSSNLYLFYGEDDFSLRRKIDHWKQEFVKKYTNQAITFFDGAQLAEPDLIRQLEDQLAPSLFSPKKLIIIRDGLPTKATQTDLAEFILKLPSSISPDFFIIFWQSQKLDGRLGFTKKFLASGITLNEFLLPHGTGLNQWIKTAAKALDVAITDQAVDLLAVFLGRDLFEEKKFGGKVFDRKEAFDLWQVYSELLKLSSASSNIDPDLVRALVKPKVPDSVFDLSDNLASGNTKPAIQSLQNYLETAAGDEKTAFIKIIGLLAEQFRSLLLVSLMLAQNFDNQAIADKLGWSSGRVFILAKHAKNFSRQTLARLLNQLLIIDSKIKTSDANPRLLVDLFISNTVNLSR